MQTPSIVSATKAGGLVKVFISMMSALFKESKAWSGEMREFPENACAAHEHAHDIGADASSLLPSGGPIAETYPARYPARTA